MFLFLYTFLIISRFPGFYLYNQQKGKKFLKLLPFVENFHKRLGYPFATSSLKVLEGLNAGIL